MLINSWKTQGVTFQQKTHIQMKNTSMEKNIIQVKKIPKMLRKTIYHISNGRIGERARRAVQGGIYFMTIK